MTSCISQGIPLLQLPRQLPTEENGMGGGICRPRFPGSTLTHTALWNAERKCVLCRSPPLLFKLRPLATGRAGERVGVSECNRLVTV